MNNCSKNKVELHLPNLNLFFRQGVYYNLVSKFTETTVSHMLKIQINFGLAFILQGLILKGCLSLQVQDFILLSD